jgi:hypothetical protein
MTAGSICTTRQQLLHYYIRANSHRFYTTLIAGLILLSKMISQVLVFIQSNILLSVVLSIVGYTLFFLGKELLRSRPDKLAESYPFENSFKLIKNYDRINEFFYDEYVKNRETYSINILVRIDCVLILNVISIISYRECLG